MCRFFIALLAVLSLGLQGCSFMPIPMSETRVNADMFEHNPDVLVGLVGQIEPSMNKTEVFAKLGITEKTPNLKRMGEQEMRQVLYGDTRPETFKDGEQFHTLLRDLEGWELPFTIKKRSLTIALPFHTQSRETGHELSVVLIFFKNGAQAGLYEKRIIGVAIVDRTEKKVLLNPLTLIKPR